MRPGRCCALLLALCGAACVSPADELSSLAEQPPLDCAVFVTGGALLAGAELPDGTFVAADVDPGGAPGEVIPIAAFVDVLERGRVFRRVGVDGESERRAVVGRQLGASTPDGAIALLLAQARAQGYDYLLVVEELKNGPIERQGTNSRWPVTFATWLLLGIGMLIPDRTFESRATLRVSLRELQNGRTLHERYLDAVPIDLSLVERGDVWGILLSIIVPPFWVGDDPESVRLAVRDTTRRRLLLSLVRELKSSSLRQQLRELVPADIVLEERNEGAMVVVRANETLAIAKLRGAGVDAASADAFVRTLLASLRVDGQQYVYTAPLPAAAAGKQVQVLVGTVRGGVASATFVPGPRR